MKYWLLLSLLLFSFGFSQTNANAWQLKRDADGIRVTQQSTDSGYPITRGTMVVDSSIDGIILLMRDSLACHRWLHSCRQSRLIEQYDAASRLDYTVIDSPYFFADRDLYTYAELTFDRQTQTVLIRLSGRESHDNGQAGKVRINNLQGFWRLQKLSATRTSLLYQIYSDPQLPPSSFLNGHIVESVFQTLRKLATVSKEDKYRNAQLDELK